MDAGSSRIVCRAILIAGPTASGKSALGLRLARELNGVLINADSMQMYRDLRVLTARPTAAEEAVAPHRLYGSVDGAVNFSVGHYVRTVVELLDGLGPPELPIFVGGTGLYFKALTQGLSAVPPVPAEVRDAVRRESAGVATADLHRRLSLGDPETARTLRPSDRLRVQRALEVLAATGRPLVDFHGARRPPALSPQGLVKLFLAPPRDELRRRIDARFTAMVDGGALDEVAALMARNLDPLLPVMRAHGVPGLVDHLRGRSTLGQAVLRGQADTRAYAKRQFTWFRHQLPDFTHVAPERGYDAVVGAGCGRLET